MKTTPLYERHRQLGAKMTEFGGWCMPLQYPQGILAEHRFVREKAAVFDTCHMGIFEVAGDSHASGLEQALTMRLDDQPVGTARYGMMCNENGGVLDDLIVFRMEPRRWWIVVNAATAKDDAAHLQSVLRRGCFHDLSSEWGKLDVQGPRSREALQKFSLDLKTLPYYAFITIRLEGRPAVVSRTGYTGELGYELFVPRDAVASVFDRLLEMDVPPAGLGARDVLRLEMGYPLYGHELTRSVTPLEAGLSRFVDLTKDFIGAAAIRRLKEKGLKKRLIGFVSEDRRRPQQTHRLFDAAGQPKGCVSSATFSPMLERGIGLGWWENDGVVPEEGALLFSGAQEPSVRLTVRHRPFYRQGSLKT